MGLPAKFSADIMLAPITVNRSQDKVPTAVLLNVPTGVC